MCWRMRTLSIDKMTFRGSTTSGLKSLEESRLVQHSMYVVGCEESVQKLFFTMIMHH